MSRFAEPMTRLIDELKKLPGVGSKSAQRLAFHILRSSQEDAQLLADAVREVKAGFECGLSLKNYNDVQVGDQLEVFEVVEVARTLA